MVRFLVKQAIAGHRNVRVGLFCEDYPALKDRQITKIHTEFPRWLGTLADSQTDGLGFKLAPQFGGGILALRNLDDPSKYASAEFAAVAIDELTKNTRETFDQLRSIVRWPGIIHNPIMGATNPGEIGHEWVKKLWIDRMFTSEDPDPSQVFFVKSLPTDNPYNTKEYIEELKRLPERLRKAYLEGNWDVFAGQFFTEWSQEKHVCKPFPLPVAFKRYRAYDHGRDKPACCKWYAIDYDGRAFVYKELYVKGLNVDQIAKRINEMSLNETYEYSVADPSIFAKLGYVDQSGGQTIAETFARNGITFIPASNRRIDGWNLMHQYLYWDEGKQPWPKLMYFNTCFDSIRTIPKLIHLQPEKGNPEDVNTFGEDHCFTGDTLVDTIYGQRAIKTLVGKRPIVFTSHGFSRARSIRKTRRSKVISVHLENGKSFMATPDHRILTQNGWKELQNLDIRYDGLIQSVICIASYLNLFKSLMVKGIIFVENIFKELARDFILWFGSISGGVSSRDFTFTTKITTEAITTYQILNKYLLLPIFHYTLELQNHGLVQGMLLSMPLNLPNHGIDQPLVGLGTQNTRRNKQKSGSGLRKFVLFVEKVIRHLNNFLLGQSIVIKIVKLQHCGEEEVYDLTVPEVGNFTINGGLIVHNCADCDRYFLLSLHETKSTKPKLELEKRLEERKRRIEGELEPSLLGDFYENQLL